jgi:hypothetical protein
LTLGIIAVQSVVFIAQTIKIAASVREAARSAKAAEDTAKITRSQFLAINRPHLRIKGLWPQGKIIADGVFRADLLLTNTGATPARIGDLRVWVIVADHPPPPPPPPCKILRPCSPGIEILGGNTLRILIESRHDLVMAGSGAASKKIFCIGFVDYFSGDDAGFSAGFCRAYNPLTLRTEATNDPDYEFDD